jgi:hypothetical protein
MNLTQEELYYLSVWSKEEFESQRAELPAHRLQQLHKADTLSLKIIFAVWQENELKEGREGLGLDSVPHLQWPWSTPVEFQLRSDEARKQLGTAWLLIYIAAGVFERLFARGNRFSLGAFMITTCIASFESVPRWSWIGLEVDYYTWLVIVGIVGFIAGFFSAERRVPGAIALAICGVGGIASAGGLLALLPMIPFFLFVIAIAIGFLPGIIFYWLVEQLFGVSLSHDEN